MDIITTNKKYPFKTRDIRDRRCNFCNEWIARKSKSGMCLRCLYNSRKGEGNPQWKGEDASPVAIHRRAIYRFGKATKCENNPCRHRKTRNFRQIAFKRDSIQRKDFKMLCKRCVAEYYETLRKETG